MILTEKEIKNVPKKMIISTYFKDNEENGNFSVAFSNSYYYTTTNSCELCDDLFRINDYRSNDKAEINAIEKYNNRREITKDLYRFALQFDVPVFLNINGQYYLLNEIKFIDYNESDEYSILKNQFESFEAYFMQEIYGVSYDVLLKKENMNGVSITAKAYDTFNNMMQKSK